MASVKWIWCFCGIIRFCPCQSIVTFLQEVGAVYYVWPFFFFLINKEESRSAAGQNTLLHNLCRSCYTLFEESDKLCFITWCVCVHAGCKANYPMQAVWGMIQLWVWTQWAHFNSHLRRTLPPSSHSGLFQFRFNSCNNIPPLYVSPDLVD